MSTKNRQFDWEGFKQELSSRSSPVLFLKEGRTQLRLLWPPSQEQPFIPVSTQFRGSGRTKTKWLVAAYIPNEGRIRAVLLPRTVVSGISDLCIEGYDLFSPQGHGITVIRTGSGLDTAYNVIVSKNPVPLEDPVLRELESFDLSAIAEAYETSQRERAGGSTPDVEEQQTAFGDLTGPDEEEIVW